MQSEKPILSKGIFPSVVTDASLLAIIGVFGYAFAYTKELGFYSYFNLPTELMLVEVDGIFLSILKLLFLVTIVQLFFVFHSKSVRKKRRRRRIILRNVVTISGVVSMIASLFLLKFEYMGTKYFYSIYSNGITFVLLGLYLTFLKYSDDGLESDNRFLKRLPINSVSILLTTLFVSTALATKGYYTGKSQAASKKYYMVLPDNRVVLRMLNDSYLVGTISYGEESLTNEFEIIRVTEQPLFTMELIGPLEGFVEDAEAP